MARNHKHIKMYITDELTESRVETFKDQTGLSASKFMQKLFNKYGTVMAAELAYEVKHGQQPELESLLAMVTKRHELYQPLISKKSQKLI